MLVVLAAIVGVATYHFLSAPAKSDSTAADKTSHVKSHDTPKPTHSTAPPVTHHKHRTVIKVTAVTGDCWVYLSTASGRFIYQGIIPAGTSRTWYEHHRVHLQLANPGAVKLTVDGKTESPGVQGQTLTIGPGRHVTA